MTIGSVLPLDWFLNLPIQQLDLNPVAQGEQDLTGGGEVLFSGLSPALWQGRVRLGRMTRSEADHAQVFFDLWLQAGRYALICDTRRPAPAADPMGVILGSSTPIVQSIAPAGVALIGLPGSYVLRRGDLIGWSYDNGRRALHRVAADVTANSSGATGMIQLTTPVREGIVVGAAASLIRPAILASLDRSSLDRGASRSVITEGATFSFRQTLMRGPA